MKVARCPSVWKNCAAFPFWLGSTVLAIAAATCFTAASHPSFSSFLTCKKEHRSPFLQAALRWHEHFRGVPVITGLSLMTFASLAMGCPAAPEGLVPVGAPFPVEPRRVVQDGFGLLQLVQSTTLRLLFRVVLAAAPISSRTLICRDPHGMDVSCVQSFNQKTNF